MGTATHAPRMMVLWTALLAAAFLHTAEGTINLKVRVSADPACPQKCGSMHVLARPAAIPGPVSLFEST